MTKVSAAGSGNRVHSVDLETLRKMQINNLFRRRWRTQVARFKEGVHQTHDQNDTVLVRIITSSSHSQNRYESLRTVLSEGGTGESGRFADEKTQDGMCLRYTA